MTTEGLNPDRDRDFERVLTFVDAVVAIAITLLSLPLVDLATQLNPGGSVGHLLVHHIPELYGFVVSFAVILRLWLAQHQVMHFVAVQDKIVTGLLLLWLLMVVVLPFPTGLLVKAPNQPATKILYLGTMAVAAACIAAISHRTANTPSIRRSEERPDMTSPVLNSAAFLIALLISLLVPVTSYWPLLILLLTDPIARRWRHSTSATRGVSDN